MSFWQAKTKLRPNDLRFSKFIRRRDGGCVFKIKCNGMMQGQTQEEYLKTLTCSHFHGRRKESVRFDPENGDTACRKCHLYLEEHKDEYYRIKLQMLGEKKFNALMVRANTPGKRDDLMTKLYFEALEKDLEEENFWRDF